MDLIDIIIAKKLAGGSGGGGGVDTTLLEDIKTALTPLLEDVPYEDYDTVIGEFIAGLEGQVDALNATVEANASVFNDIKTAINDKGGSVGEAVEDYAQAITDLPSGDGELFAVDAENNIGWNPELNWNLDCGAATMVTNSVFQKAMIREAKGSNIERIGEYAFGSCYNLSVVSFPSCETILKGAFNYCSSLDNVSFPVCKEVGGSAFTDCTKLSAVSLPTCMSVGEYAFRGCYALKEISLPVCNSFGSNVFNGCTHLVKADLPACTSIGSYFFSNCSALATVNLPICSTIGNNAFASCSSLQALSLPACNTIVASAFNRCYNLLSLYLLGSSTATLGNANAFISTPISTYTTSTAGVRGNIFVRASLLESWKQATNWVTYSSRFVGLTDAEIAAL